MTIFTKIINEGQAHVIYSDDKCSAILDIRPAAPGHSLVIPKVEVDHWLDLDSEIISHLNSVAQKVGRAQMQVFKPKRIGIMIAGFEVPHAHIHVIPLNDMGDFELGQLEAEESQLVEHCDLLINELM